LWPNFPDALQHWEHGEFLIPGIGQKLGSGLYSLAGELLLRLANCFCAGTWRLAGRRI
jgi:hypothetical protein